MSEIFVNRTNPLAQIKELQQKSTSKQEPGQGEFSQVLANALEEVNTLQQTSNQEVQKLLSGEIKDVHSAMIAMQKAGLSFQMVMQVRNKLVEAYQEVMRMQI